MIEVVALSGGKDSTAMALRLVELEPDRERIFFCSPTGDELPEMVAHWERLECLLGQSIVRVTNGSLTGLIDRFGALPNHRQRWCTRILKIEPCLAFIAGLQREATLCVGLRADEEEREGICSSSITSRFPLREWGWGEKRVRAYLRERGVTVPARTDCARCYGQRLGEWWMLWKTRPEIYAHAEEQERATGHTFRSPSREKGQWPAGLAELRAEFARGRLPRGTKRQLPLLDEDDPHGACRVCTL